MTGESVIRVPVVPPSLNKIATRGSRFATSRAKKDLQEQFHWELLLQRVPEGLRRVVASATLQFPTRHRRDPGNFSWLIEKSLGDALAPHDRAAPHRWLADDTADYFVFQTPITILPDRGPAFTEVRLIWWKP